MQHDPRRPLLIELFAGPLTGLSYALMWLLLWRAGPAYGPLLFGLRFGVLLLAPLRHWGWVLGLELLAAAAIGFQAGGQSGSLLLLVVDVPNMLIVGVGLWLLRQAHLRPSLREPDDVIRLLLSALLVVTAATALNAAVLALLHQNIASSEMIRLLGLELLGNYLGILLLVPPLIMLTHGRLDRHRVTALITDGLLVMLPAMAILLILCQHAEPLPRFARVLSLAPVLFFAFRHGWRGAGLALFITNVGITVVTAALDQPPPSAAAYLFLAVAGTGALMLGSATDALRRSNAQVSAQNADLAAINKRLDELARQLREAARGNLQADEIQRRHMAAELHDELGQNITAIQTHMKLAQSQLQRVDMDGVVESVNSILAHMRRALHRLLNDLRPAVLDEFGLIRALEEGPICDLLHAAGVTYRTRMHGNPRLLDEDVRTAIYRLVQESATNAVKHARATHFHVRLRIGQRHGSTLALLQISDDGCGLDGAKAHGGRGLQGMKNRVTSLGGYFKLDSNRCGVRLRVMLHGNAAGDGAPPPV